MGEQWRWLGPDGLEHAGSVDELRQLLYSGRLAWTTNVWRAGFPGWVPASSVTELGAPAQAQPFAVEDEGPTLRENPKPEAPAPAVAPPRKQGAAGLIFTLAGAIGGAVVLGAIGGFGAYANAAAKKIPDVPVSLGSASGDATAGSAAPTAAHMTLSCRAAPPKQLAKQVLGKVPLEVVEAGQGKLAIGFAESKGRARAMLLTVADLATGPVKSEDSDAPITGVVPIVSGDDLELHIDADKKDLHAAKTVHGGKRFTLGSTSDGIVKQEGDGAPSVVWRGSEGEVTVPRVGTLAGLGHFIAFRRGGQGGKIEAGWLEMDGDKKSELVAPKIEASAVGTPSAAVSPAGVLLLAAGRGDAKAPWRVFAGSSDPGAVPEALAPLELGDPAISRISPSAASLGRGHWLLQWTEGAEDAHVVRVVPLDGKLAPMGEPVTVSAPGADAGQGVIHATGESSVSLFLVSSGDSHELWGAALTCK